MLGCPKQKPLGWCPHFSMSLSSKYQIKHLGPFTLALELLLNLYSLLPLYRVHPQVCLTLSGLLQFYLIHFNRQLSACKYLKLFYWWQWSSHNPNLIVRQLHCSGNLKKPDGIKRFLGAGHAKRLSPSFLSIFPMLNHLFETNRKLERRRSSRNGKYMNKYK